MVSDVTPKDELLRQLGGDPGPIFHLKDGFSFVRERVTGKVVILCEGPAGPWLTLVDDSSWASAVAHVSARGDTGETHAEALEFHNREPA